ncbi:MAG TPA: 3-deoxy-D-manno-octulosonic acid kinase [Rhodanobacteraceae bacterium]|nr:3-deoxy-D-manno-octulosonic acid kinase [Rhodanobacteraceae bacterium]
MIVPGSHSSPAEVTDARIDAGAEGAILFDAGLAVQPDDRWFDPGHWRARGKLHDQARGGRGSVVFVETPAGVCALRHYHRGGMVAPILGDRYLWTGAERTRGFAEFRLLAELQRRDLPVPVPIAARYRRHGIHYTADLLTRRIERTRTLAEFIAAGELDAALAGRVGELVARFHAQGVDHADLNAHNVLIGPNGPWLVDFDRGRIRVSQGGWCQGNLLRLRRSLLKLGACDRDEKKLDREIWTSLISAYRGAPS